MEGCDILDFDPDFDGLSEMHWRAHTHTQTHKHTRGLHTNSSFDSKYTFLKFGFRAVRHESSVTLMDGDYDGRY